MKVNPKISEYMTTKPYVIGKDASISEAMNLMRKEIVRHLPIVDEDGALIGLITDRDVKLASSLEGADRMKVEGVMVLLPYSVDHNAPLSEVVLEMAEKKYGCVLVIREGKLAGILTSDDGLRILGEMLEEAQRSVAA